MKSITSNASDITHSRMPQITSKDHWGYDLALKSAALSNCRYMLGAAIIGKGSNVLSLGTNVLKSHTDHTRWPPHVVSVHAEHHCIRHARHRNIDLRGTTMYIARLGGNEISRPCDMCMEYIYLAGIKNIVYSNGTTLVKARVW